MDILAVLQIWPPFGVSAPAAPPLVIPGLSAVLVGTDDDFAQVDPDAARARN